ncbi:hypothetical protein [Thiocapsa sp.]|uniref:hypothetical protein n=1 Tax=Thiocapsa sp. TaxID=2024551 RepID=UPI0025F126C3|nr:hypothetical protein [Thiocapsa sp.]
MPNCLLAYDVAALQALVADYLKAVIHYEYNRLTGLPGIKGASGAPSADAALDAVRDYIAERKSAGDWSKQTGEGMLSVYRALQQARQKRLAQRAAISLPVLVLVTALAGSRPVSPSLAATFDRGYHPQPAPAIPCHPNQCGRRPRHPPPGRLKTCSTHRESPCNAFRESQS